MKHWISSSRVLPAVCAVVLWALVPCAIAQQAEDFKLRPSDEAGVRFFGHSVSITGAPGHAVAIVGAYGDNHNGHNSGSAYIYRFNDATWVEEAKLLDSDGAQDDRFGWSVSITGEPGKEVAIVGARLDDDAGIGSGSAFIYRFNGATWVEEAKLLASGGAPSGADFGWSVSITGPPGNEVAIVGTPDDVNNSMRAGSATIYRFDGSSWVEEAKLLASDGAVRDRFGHSVSINGPPGNEIAIVGALHQGNGGVFSGWGYIYRRVGATWVEEAKLIASDGAEGDKFGLAVSISNAPGQEVAIVGAPSALSDDGSRAGSAYIYRFNGANWFEEARLLASNGAEDDFFGGSVSISGDPGKEVVIIGAVKGEHNNGVRAGSAYIYRYNGATWVEKEKLLASDGAADDFFGVSVSITGEPGNEVAIVGASQDSGSHGLDFGSAYVYERIIDSCPADLNRDGIVDVLDLLLVVHALRTRGEAAEDLDGDGNVTPRDMHIVIQSFGSCP